MVFVRTSLFFVKCSLLYLPQCSIRKTNPKSFLTMLIKGDIIIWIRYYDALLFCIRVIVLSTLLAISINYHKYSKYSDKSGKREWNYFEFNRNLVLSASQITGLIEAFWMGESSSLYDHQLVTVHKSLGRLIWNRWV